MKKGFALAVMMVGVSAWAWTPTLKLDDSLDADAKKAITAVHEAAMKNDAAALKAMAAPKSHLPDWKLHPEKMRLVLEALSHGCLTDESQDESARKSDENTIFCPVSEDQEADETPGVTLTFVKTPKGWLLKDMKPRPKGMAVPPPEKETAADKAPPANTTTGNAPAAGGDVPPEVTAQLGKLKAAVEKKDFDALKAILPSSFTVDQMSRDDALDYWKGHPKKLNQISDALNAGCGVAANTGGKSITCPKLTGTEKKGSVRFLSLNRDDKGNWKFASFDVNEED